MEQTHVWWRWFNQCFNSFTEYAWHRSKIRQPLVGHLAVRDMFQVYNHHSFNQSFANFKIHSTSNFKVYSIKISFQSSCNLFLCLYRAFGHSFYHPLGGALKLGSPREFLQHPSNFRYFVHRFLVPKWISKRIQNHHKTEFQSRSESHSVFLSLWHPKWNPQSTKTAILLK